MAELSLFVVFLLQLIRVGSSIQAEEMTNVLDHLLDRYDKNIRPNIGGGPLEIQTNLEVRSMGPLSEKEMVYSLQIYFRQVWYDERLRFDLPNTTEITLSQRFLPKIWRPTTFFFNGISATQNIITVPNFFVRVQNDGRIYLSKRLSITARCPMNLVKYPMDAPSCPLVIGGYGVNTDEMTYTWRLGNDKSVTKGVSVLMAQFEFNDIKAWNRTIKTPHGEASILISYFYFRRYLGYYTMNMYLPGYLTVLISWVSFWINRDAIPARVLLGVTTLLSITTIGITVRFGLPGVPYATALDLFFIVCFVYVFASLVEFAGVHFFAKLQQHGSSKRHSFSAGLTNHPASDSESDEDDEDEAVKKAINHSSNVDEEEINDNESNSRRQRRHHSCPKSFWYCLSGNTTHMKQFSSQLNDNSVSDIDVACRMLFPLSFIGINLLYWIIYLNSDLGNEQVELKLD